MIFLPTDYKFLILCFLWWAFNSTKFEFCFCAFVLVVLHCCRYEWRNQKSPDFDPKEEHNLKSEICLFEKFAPFYIFAAWQCPVSGSWEADSGVWANSFANFLRPGMGLWLSRQKKTDKNNTIWAKGKVEFGLTPALTSGPFAINISISTVITFHHYDGPWSTY